MAVIHWRGGAQRVAQVTNVTPAGTVETGDLFKLSIGQKILTYASTANTVASVVTGFTAAFNASTNPEFMEITATVAGATSITLTADTPGIPFTVNTTTLEADGSTSDSQTFTTTTAGTANKGPNSFTSSENYNTGTVPVSSDILVIENNNVDILYDLSSTGVILDELLIGQNYTGKIGLPERNAGGYPEYRPTSLEIGSDIVRIGYGTGVGSGRIKLALQTAQTAINILNSGTPLENGVESILITATNSSNTLQVLKGSVGVAVTGGSTSNFALRVDIGYTNQVASDAKVRFGAGCSLATFNQRGGEVETNSAITTLTMTNGTHTKQAGTVGTLVIDGGLCVYNSTGTISIAAIGSAGTLDLSKGLGGVTMTTHDMWKGASHLDPSQRGTYTNAIDLNRCGLEDVTLVLGKNRRLTPGTPA